MAKVLQARAILLLILLSYITRTDAAATHRHCGIELLEVLTSVCKGKGFYQGRLRGSHLRISLEHSVRNRKTRRKGIVEKCCVQPCSYSDLQRYCKE